MRTNHETELGSEYVDQGAQGLSSVILVLINFIIYSSFRPLIFAALAYSMLDPKHCTGRMSPESHAFGNPKGLTGKAGTGLGTSHMARSR
jgi:hypothetical protein